MKKTLIMLCLLLLATNAFCMDNSLSNREAQAQRYLETTPPKALFEDMAEKVSLNLPPSERQVFKDLLTKHLDIDSLIRTMKTALINNFTAEELSALADFYGSNVGKSAMTKFGTYMAEVMPALQNEMKKAYVKVSSELESKKQ